MAKKSSGNVFTLNGYGTGSVKDIARGLLDNLTIYWKPVYQAGRMPQGNFRLQAAPAGWSTGGITPGRIWNNLERKLSGDGRDRFVVSEKDNVFSVPLGGNAQDGRTGIRDIDRYYSEMGRGREKPERFTYSVGPYKKEEEENVWAGYGDGGSVGATRDIGHLARLFGLKSKEIG